MGDFLFEEVANLRQAVVALFAGASAEQRRNVLTTLVENGHESPLAMFQEVQAGLKNDRGAEVARVFQAKLIDSIESSDDLSSDLVLCEPKPKPKLDKEVADAGRNLFELVMRTIGHSTEFQKIMEFYKPSIDCKLEIVKKSIETRFHDGIIAFFSDLDGTAQCDLLKNAAWETDIIEIILDFIHLNEDGFGVLIKHNYHERLMMVLDCHDYSVEELRLFMTMAINENRRRMVRVLRVAIDKKI